MKGFDIKDSIQNVSKSQVASFTKFSYFDDNLLHKKLIVAILSLKVKLSLISTATKVKFACIAALYLLARSNAHLLASLQFLVSAFVKQIFCFDKIQKSYCQKNPICKENFRIYHLLILVYVAI